MNICLLGIMYLDLLKRLLKEKTESMIFIMESACYGTDLAGNDVTIGAIVTRL